jgi:hypothetical protein
MFLLDDTTEDATSMLAKRQEANHMVKEICNKKKKE